MPDKPFSPSCERNQAPILTHLRQLFDQPGHVLEIGSGTGQHAVYFGKHLPHLDWQTSDLQVNHSGIVSWIEEAGLDNVQPPVELNVLTSAWPQHPVRYVFTANTAHIMPWEAVKAMIQGAGALLGKDGRMIVYGPFKYGGQFTSESNASFDQNLRNGHGHMGIRDIEAVCEVASQVGLQLEQDIPMPANNQMLVFEHAKEARS